MPPVIEVRFTGATADEVNEAAKDFVSKIKGTRGGKSKGDDEGAATAGNAPQPMQPPQGQQQGFNPNAAPQGGFNPGGAPQGGFNPGAQTMQSGPSPEVQALVQRINGRIDAAIQSGQPADQVLTWFRGQCGPEAANATLDQIKTVCLYKAPMPTLEGIAKLMNA